MKKIDLMHSMFGRSTGKRCEECAHLKELHDNRTYFKCEVYGITASEATDWRKSFPACGLFNKFTAYDNVYRLAKEEKSDIAEGQISLF